jgi:uncharacterized protein (DUF885 family)
MASLVTLWTQLFAELKEIHKSQTTSVENKKLIRILHKEMNTREVIKDRSKRIELLNRAVRFIDGQISSYEEDQQSGTHDEMAVLDEEISRLSDLKDSAEEWARMLKN